MKLLDTVGLHPSRSAMEGALDKLDWSSIKGKNDVFGAVFRAAFRWVKSTKPRRKNETGVSLAWRKRSWLTKQLGGGVGGGLTCCLS